MPTVIWSPQARADLDELWDQFALEYQNPEAARRYLRGIEQRCRMLAQHPQAGRLRPELDAQQALRSFPHREYIIYYRPATGGIEVARVLHAARDHESLFAGEPNGDDES